MAGEFVFYFFTTQRYDRHPPCRQGLWAESLPSNLDMTESRLQQNHVGRMVEEELGIILLRKLMGVRRGYSEATVMHRQSCVGGTKDEDSGGAVSVPMCNREVVE